MKVSGNMGAVQIPYASFIKAQIKLAKFIFLLPDKGRFEAEITNTTTASLNSIENLGRRKMAETNVSGALGVVTAVEFLNAAGVFSIDAIDDVVFSVEADAHGATDLFFKQGDEYYAVQVKSRDPRKFEGMRTLIEDYVPNDEPNRTELIQQLMGSYIFEVGGERDLGVGDIGGITERDYDRMRAYIEEKNEYPIDNVNFLGIIVPNRTAGFISSGTGLVDANAPEAQFYTECYQAAAELEEESLFEFGRWKVRIDQALEKKKERLEPKKKSRRKKRREKYHEEQSLEKKERPKIKDLLEELNRTREAYEAARVARQEYRSVYTRERDPQIHHERMEEDLQYHEAEMLNRKLRSQFDKSLNQYKKAQERYQLALEKAKQTPVTV